MTFSRRFSALVAALAAALVAAGCGGTSASGHAAAAVPTSANKIASPSKDPSIAAELPTSVRARGTLTVASDATYPPFESFSGNQSSIVGLDPDLAHAIGDVLGVKVTVVNVTFDSIIPGLAAHRYDMAMSSLGDTMERQRSVDFVTYYQNVTEALVPHGNPKHLSMSDLCGEQVAVVRGSLQETPMAPALSTRCRADGKGPLRVATYASDQASILALRSGRMDAVLADAPPLVEAVSTASGAFSIVGPAMRNANPGGIAVPKDSGLTEPLLAAIKVLMADGTYAQILAHWRLRSIAIHDPAINAAVS